MRMARGKCTTSPHVVLNVQGPESTVLLVNNDNCNVTYLVDTGTEASIVPHASCLNNTHLSNVSAPCKLYAANGSVITSCGMVTRSLQLHGHFFSGYFIQAVVWHPIIVADFLRNHRLMVYVAGLRLPLPGLDGSIPSRLQYSVQ